MKIASVVVWFNPDKLDGENTAVNNIKSYSQNFEKVYIVDNSSEDNSTLANQISNAVYISNKNFNGIAGALNKGCQEAKNDGFEWVITVDQDSRFEDAVIKEFIETSEKYYNENNKNVSFSISYDTGKSKKQRLPLHKFIQFKILSPIKRKILHQNNLPPAGFDAKIPVSCKIRVITSGNIINLDAWEKVGKFDERLFIDFVDFDFTYRLYLAGFGILKFSWLHFKHQVGELKRSFIKKEMPIESDFRVRYIFRNLIVLIHRYPEIDVFAEYLKKFKREYCIFNFRAQKYREILKEAALEAEKMIKEEKDN